MPRTISVQEAVWLAKEALGNVPASEFSVWIATNLGLTVNPVIVTVMLGSFLEKESRVSSSLVRYPAQASGCDCRQDRCFIPCVGPTRAK